MIEEQAKMKPLGTIRMSSPGELAMVLFPGNHVK